MCGACSPLPPPLSKPFYLMRALPRPDDTFFFFSRPSTQCTMWQRSSKAHQWFAAPPRSTAVHAKLLLLYCHHSEVPTVHSYEALRYTRVSVTRDMRTEGHACLPRKQPLRDEQRTPQPCVFRVACLSPLFCVVFVTIVLSTIVTNTTSTIVTPKHHQLRIYVGGGRAAHGESRYLSWRTGRTCRTRSTPPTNGWAW